VNNNRGKYPPSSPYRPGQNRPSDNWQARAGREFINNRPNQSGLHPALKAALIMMIPLILLYVLDAFVFPIAFFIFYPIEWIIYIICGNLSARFFADSIHHVRPRNLADQAVKMGAGAGLTLGILSLIFLLVLTFALQLTVLQIAWFGTITIAICAPLEVIIALCLGALGGKIFESSWR
jgi:hypothetical protein